MNFEYMNRNATCRICSAKCTESKIPMAETVLDGLTLADIHSRVVNFDLFLDDRLPCVCCSKCREQMLAVYTFLEQWKIVDQRFRALYRKPTADDTCDPLEEWEIKQELQKQLSDDESTSTSNRDNHDSRLSEEDSGDCKDSDPEDEKQIRKEATGRQPQGVMKLQPQPKRCCGCKEPLRTVDEVAQHSAKFHARHREASFEKSFECSVCFQWFDKRKEYLQHCRKRYVAQLHMCSKCTADFANAYSLKIHERTMHKRRRIIEVIDEMRERIHKCCNCRLQFDTRELLKQHGRDVHRPEIDRLNTGNRFECDICYRRFKTDKVLTEHRRRPFRKNRFQCLHCGKTFKEKQQFRDHEQGHANIRPYECPICHKRFHLKPNYLTHVRYHSVPDDQFKCDHCGKGFKKKHLLKEHQEVHSDSRPYKCHLCTTTFTRKDLLDFHVKDHLGEKPFKCTLCTATYIHERDLRRHRRAKHEGIQPFVCDICAKAFCRRDAYQKHRRTHRKDADGSSELVEIKDATH